jgi:hypothetical protein
VRSHSAGVNDAKPSASASEWKRPHSRRIQAILRDVTGRIACHFSSLQFEAKSWQQEENDTGITTLVRKLPIERQMHFGIKIRELILGELENVDISRCHPCNDHEKEHALLGNGR